jgi:hypothetical protein
MVRKRFGLGKLKRAEILVSLCEPKLCMIDPLPPKLNSISCEATADRDNLKLWLRELTHLSPQQVEYVLTQREQVLLAAPISKIA